MLSCAGSVLRTGVIDVWADFTFLLRLPSLCSRPCPPNIRDDGEHDDSTEGRECQEHCKPRVSQVDKHQFIIYIKEIVVDLERRFMQLRLKYRDTLARRPTSENEDQESWAFWLTWSTEHPLSSVWSPTVEPRLRSPRTGIK